MRQCRVPTFRFSASGRENKENELKKKIILLAGVTRTRKIVCSRFTRTTLVLKRIPLMRKLG